MYLTGVLRLSYKYKRYSNGMNNPAITQFWAVNWILFPFDCCQSNQDKKEKIKEIKPDITVKWDAES